MKSGSRFATRLWYYFRIGYATYLTFILGYVSTLITVYYLAIKNLPDLLNLFPHFGPFAVLATLLGGPLSVIIGWLHLKRSSAFTSEQDISVESNPYTYRVAPGKEAEIIYPTYFAMLEMMRHVLESQNLLSDAERARIDDLVSKMTSLLKGEVVGTPRRKKLAPP